MVSLLLPGWAQAAETATLRGPGWELVIVQQPKRCWDCVTPRRGEATLFREAANRGVIGLLAHDYLSGSTWYALKPGDALIVQYRGEERVYIVSQTFEYFRGGAVPESKIYNLAYTRQGQLTLQTCLSRDGRRGFWFVFAQPAEE